MKIQILSLMVLTCFFAGCAQKQDSNETGQVYNGNRNLLSPGELVPFEMEWRNSKTSRLNLSFMLEKPAGRDGFIIIKDGHFIKPNGDRFKIWGVNLTGGACFPEKEDAADYTAYLARFGINAVRLHFLDSNWGQERSLFNFQLDHTRELYPPQLDKLDYFINELKKAGIYTNINLNVGRTYRKGDGVPEFEYLGFAKAVTLFDDHIIELQKEYARQLLTHVNPYTGNAYINEPAIVIVEIVNENSLIEAWVSGRLRGQKTTPGGGTWIDISPYYGKELTRKYNQWLKGNINPSDIAAIEKEAGVRPGSEIPRLLPEEFNKASTLRFHTEATFITETERKFYTGMHHYLKKELGVKSPVVANSDHSHYRNYYALLSNLALLDVVDGHVYWQHPSARKDPVTGEQYSTIENTPMVNNPGFSTVSQLARSAVKGKPYTVSETNHPFPNEYACEGIPLLSAYASLQDWDGIFMYTLEHVAPHLWKTNYPGSFGIAVDPVKMAGMAAHGLMFLRNDLRPAPTCVYRGYSVQQVKEGLREVSKDRPFFTEGFSPLIPLIYKTRAESFEQQVTDYPQPGELTEIKAETGEIIWHTGDRAFVEVSVPKTESLIGFLPEKTSLLKHLQVNIKNNFAAITLTSLDNLPLTSSKQMLLIATGKSGMTGMKWDETRNRLLEPGAQPATIEVIQGEIMVSGLGRTKSVIIEPLDGGGNPMSSIILQVRKRSVKIPVGIEKTVWYYIQLK